MSSLDRILPFLRPIEDLLRDPSVTELMVNDGGRRVFVERAGGVELVPGRTLESRNLTVAIKNIARACGDEISELQPILDARLDDLVAAINRGEGLNSSDIARGGLAIAIRDVPGGTIREYRIFPRDSLELSVAKVQESRYLECEPDSLELAAKAAGGYAARLRIRLDLFELLQRQRDGYLPSVAELQGRYVDLVIFKNQLSATPYQEVILTTDDLDAHRISREPGGRLVMTVLAADEEARDGS